MSLFSGTHDEHVMVPRSVLERLLRHADTAQKRFPTRTVGQIVQTLRHILGIDR